MSTINFEEVTINQFIKAKFKSDFSEITQEQLKEIETQYADTAGLYETEEFNKVAYIHYLNNRINSVKLSIRLQFEFLHEFGMPYVPELKFFNKFGHRIFWENNQDKFIEDLRKIEGKEKRYMSQLENNIKELKDIRAKKLKNDGGEPKKQTRAEFLSTILSLGKIGYKIDRNETTVEELALIIKKQTEEVNESNNRQNKKY